VETDGMTWGSLIALGLLAVLIVLRVKGGG
jgi:hypothetical protein